MANNEVKVRFDFFTSTTASSMFSIPVAETYTDEDFHISVNNSINSIFIGNQNTSNYLRLGNNKTFFGNTISLPKGLHITPDTMSIYDSLNTTYINGGNKYITLKADEISLEYSPFNSSNKLRFKGNNDCEISLANNKNIQFDCKMGIGLQHLYDKQLEVLSEIRIINASNASSFLDIDTGILALSKYASIKTGKNIEPLMLQSHGGKVSLGLMDLPVKQLEILSDIRIVNAYHKTSFLDIYTGLTLGSEYAAINTAANIEPLMLQTHGGKVSVGMGVFPQKHLEILSDFRIVNDGQMTSFLDIYTGSLGISKCATIKTSLNTEPLMIQTHGGRVGIGFNNRVPSDTLEVEGSVKIVGSVVNGSDDRIKTNERYITDATKTLSKLKPQIYTKNNIKVEAGLIAQEVFYDAPELRHLVALPPDADISYITSHHVDTSKFPEKDPEYKGWGNTIAGINYIELIPYLVRYVHENNVEMDALRERINTLEKYMNDNK
jgi:hypothetical protein